MQRAPGSAGMVWLLRGGIVVLLAAAVTGWLAVGRANHASRSAAALQSATLASAVTLAESASTMATQLQATIEALSVSAGSTDEAIGHTIEIAQGLQAVLTAVDGLDNLGAPAMATLASLATRLDDIAAQLLENQGGVGETQAALAAAQPLIDSTVTALQPIPDQLRTAQTGLDVQRTDADDSATLWRVTIVLAALVMGVALFALTQP